VAVRVSVEQPLHRMTVEHDQAAALGQQAMDRRGPRVEVMQPDERAATGVDEVRGPVELGRHVEDVRQDPAGGRPDRVR
jgi:hypothetical protein